MIRYDLIAYALKRTFLLVPVWIGVSLVSFSVVHISPGSPMDVMLPPGTRTPERIALIEEQFGFDQPLHVQYLDWLGNAVTGDLGISLAQRQPVNELILGSIYPTFQLAFMAVFFAMVLGVPLGVVSAVKKGTWIDQLTRVLAFGSVAMPRFWFGLLLILFLGQYWGQWFGGGLISTGGFASPSEGIIPFLRHALAPALAASIVYIGIILRITRGAVTEELEKQYVQTARSKGRGERAVMGLHVLRNAMIPIITVAGIQFGQLMNGLVVIEEVFSIPGLGRLLFRSVYNQDVPVIMGLMVVVGTVFVLTNLTVDLLYAYFDPRITYEASEQ